jgi:uncharacterized lipoprotein YddW (UPF0748 family)
MLVKRIHDEVKSVNPDVIVSAAVGTTSPDPQERKVSVQGQAVWEWLDQGWIDAAFVMSYGADTQTVVDRNQGFVAAVQNPQSRETIFPALATYTIDNPNEQRTYLLEEQVKALMRAEWTGRPLEPAVGGVALFVDKYLHAEAIQMLADGPFEKPALPYWGKAR